MPALIFAIVVTQAPFLLTIWYSFQRYNLKRPDMRGFVGLDNYRFIIQRDPAFREAIFNTVVFVVGAVLVSLAPRPALRRAGQPPLLRAAASSARC